MRLNKDSELETVWLDSHMRFRLAFLIALLSYLITTQGRAQTFQQVIEGAKKEGQVRVYASMRKESAAAIINAFRNKYPFVRHVDHHRFTLLEESERVLAELRAGRVDMDVLLVRSELWDRHKPFLASAIDWKALGVHPDRINKDGLETTWAGSGIGGIVYNDKTVPHDKAPKKWEDCLDPYWKGRFSVWVRPHLPLRFIPVWGEEKVMEFSRQLAANQPVWVRNPTGAMELAASGEVPLFCGGDHLRWLDFHKKGAPVKLVIPEPAITSEGRGLSLVKAAKYPNAGKLFMVYMASDEAQLILDKAEGRGHMSVPGTMAHELVKGKKLSVFTDELDVRSNELSKKILEVWGFPVAK